MVDSISKERRSWNMSQIRSRDTKPEKVVRSLLHRMGYRFRLHVRGLPGIPDIVMPKHKTVVFIHGCFWHQHAGCKYAYKPKSNVEFWRKKLEANVLRDEAAAALLRNLGWKTIIVWECELAQLTRLRRRLRRCLG